MMTEFALLYALIGTGCVAALFMGVGSPHRAVDLVLMLVIWPLYAPFLLGRPGASVRAKDRSDFLDAIDRAEGTSLAALLPSPATASGLNDRLIAAEHRVAEIESLLRQPDFDEAAAEARARELEDRSETLASSIASARMKNIRQLKQMRDRFNRELSEIRELLAQLRLQAEMVRLAGSADGGSREVVRMLLARVEGLGAILDAEGNGTGAP
jgi:hypothetical protein